MLPLILILLGVGAAVALSKKKAPVPVKAPAPPQKIVPPTLDKGMPFPLAHSVAVALALEKNIDNLKQFAAAMKDFPIARGLIIAKGRVLEAAADAEKKYRRPDQASAIQAAIDAPTMQDAIAFIQWNNVPPTAGVLDKIQQGRAAKTATEKVRAQAVHDAARATGNVTTAQVLSQFPTVKRDPALLDDINREKARLVAAVKNPSSWKDFEDNPFVTINGPQAALKSLIDASDKLGMPPITLVRSVTGSPGLTYAPGSTNDKYTITNPAGGTPVTHLTAKGWTKAADQARAMLTGENDQGYQSYLQTNPTPRLDYVAWKRTQDPAWVDMMQKNAQAIAAANKRIQDEIEKSKGFFSKIGDALSDATEGLGDAVQSAMSVANKIPGMQTITAPLRAAEIGNSFLKDVATGKNIAEDLKQKTQELTDVGKGVVSQIKTAAPVLAYVPGIGQGAAMALTTAAGVAMGEPVSDAALDGVASALPGAPLSQAAFKAAVKATQAVAEGKPLSEAALSAAREGFSAAAQKVGVPKEAAGAAFDSGVALGKGKSLQDAGFAAMHDLAQGNDLVQKATNFTEALAKAKEQGRGVRDVLIDQAVDNVTKAGSDAAETQLRPLLSQMTSNPDLMNLKPADLAKKAGVPESIAHAALAATRPVTDKIRVLDPNIVNRLLPNAPIVSPAAKQLLQDPAKLAQVKQLADAGNKDAQVVQTAAEIAKMNQEKQRWQDYYEALGRKAA
jgi:hypothetical protein